MDQLKESASAPTVDAKIKVAVREHYRNAVVNQSGCGCGCDCDTVSSEQVSKAMGYSSEELSQIPAEAVLGLGCGNPHGIAALQMGETVVDLGSGAGIDCFLAAKRVGSQGRVIGVDMTPEMIDKSRQLARQNGFENVEFRLGEIEHLPIADATVDVILSNCVINLAPDKRPVYREAFRVLKPGGRLAISDVVAVREVPDAIQRDSSLWSSCAAGALSVHQLRDMLAEVGFADIQITTVDSSRDLIKEWSKGTKVEDYFLSSLIQAIKPGIHSGGRKNEQ